MNYEETLAYLYSRLPVFHQVGASAYKPGLDNSIQMMEQLGNPQNTYKTIHVAGTNGKGSVSHFLSAILQSAGYKVGLYTSPHLIDFGERIRVDGEQIDTDFVVNFVEKNETLFDQIQPSFFEATMAMAFAYFADCDVDIAVIEVGLGGRLDSTNIIQPILSVITNIGLDHTEFLGNTLEKIASEKAGIIKHATPVVIGETQDDTKLVFKEKALSEQVPIVFAEDRYQAELVGYEHEKMIVNVSNVGRLNIGLSGDYQLKNVVAVLASVDELKKIGLQIAPEHIAKGIEDVVSMTQLAGRWQIIRRNPTIVLDTGHNKAGIQYVSAQLKRQSYNTLHIVVGMVDDKDVDGVLELLPQDAIYYFTAANTKRALSPENIKAVADKRGLTGEAYDTINQAVEAALKAAKEDDFIFIGGSNFVVGEALDYLQNQR